MSKIEVTTLSNANGLVLEISNLGATIISLNVPDKNKQLVNVVVGLEAEDFNKEPYLSNYTYLGTSIGRYAGRISKGEFKIEGKSYPIYNENGVHLHGGKIGFDKKYWNVEHLDKGKNPFVTFSCESEHLEEGYPGNLNATVTYQLTEKNEVKVTYKATTDEATPVNLTNHAYFNLNGKDSILDHKLKLNSKQYLEVDSQLIPSGKLINSKNTRFDFNEESVIGRPDFIGFDDTFVLEEGFLKAVLTAPKTGIQMKVYTNQPASVIYTPVLLEGVPFKNGVSYSKFSAICFETQNFPDAPNNAHFPSSILHPNEIYSNESIFEFSIV
ncbi:galactose mutarotase [Lutibacter sp. HS1-25]|uniref:aldose epimerase family protein n=1 Tax=Lutibacter sp. HS1-25 TaxID=2485000 RepID=UPI0010103EEA|nr:aldose epimerase family protein [Lutibacter sp. HS1-25]RXP64578.1 galactose mutarotase [Lutibacter sp. HS1-25]